MKTDMECWRLWQRCERWAAETLDSGVRNAFLAMAKELSRLQEAADEETAEGRRSLLD